MVFGYPIILFYNMQIYLKVSNCKIISLKYYRILKFYSEDIVDLQTDEVMFMSSGTGKTLSISGIAMIAV